MKTIALILTITFASLRLAAQQDPVISQYMFNGMLLNPAYAGSKQYFSSTLLHRSQWTGWEGAPRTQVFTFHSLLRDQVSGVGFTLSNDHVGVTNKVDAYLNYAYHIRMGDKHSLSFGLKGGVAYYTADLDKLVYWDQEDQVFQGGFQTNLVPNAGAGAYFYSEHFYAGLSVPHLLSYDPKEMFSIGGDIATIPHMRRHYYLTSGYAAEVSPDVVVKPSVLLKYVPGTPLQADFNVNVLLKNRVWVGGSWRTGDSFVGLLEAQVTPRFRIGYSYDYTLTPIGNYSHGSHELMLGYDFGFKALKMKSPRYF